MKKQIRGNRTFLARLLALTLAVCMLPLLVLSIHMMNEQKQRLRESEQLQLETVAQNVAGQWDSYLVTIDEIQLAHQLHIALKTATLSSGVIAEMEAIETMSNLQMGQNYLYENGIICLDENPVVYTSYFKHQIRYYAPQRLGMSGAEFLDVLNRTEKASFLPYHEMQQTMVYLYPETRSIRGTRRIGVYVFTASLLLNSFDALLQDSYALDWIRDSSGTVIYQSNAPAAERAAESGDKPETRTQGVFRTRSVSSRGYEFSLRKNENVLSERLSSYVRTVTILISVVAGVTALCAVAAVGYNYRPIRRAVQRIDPEDTGEGGNEIAAIYNAYASQKEKREQLEIKSETYRSMMLERIYRCLLGGRALTNEEFALLHWQDMLYCVAVCDLVDCGVMEDAQRRGLEAAHILAVSMRMDGVIAFICYLNREERTDRLQAVRLIQSAVNNPDAVLGISRVYRASNDFRTAYLESTLAVQNHAGEGGAYFAEDALPQEESLFFETSFDTMQLIGMLRRGDEQAVALVEGLLDRLELSGEADSRRSYAFFRLLEYLRGSMQKAGVAAEENRFAEIAGISGVAERHDAVKELIREAIEGRRKALVLEKDALEKEMIAYTEQRFCDSGFGLDQFAERFHMSPSAASRAFKDVVGVNFKKYINNRRIALAKLLLEATDEGMAEIAEKTGFASAGYFGQAFRMAEGVSPAVYREQHAKKTGTNV